MPFRYRPVSGCRSHRPENLLHLAGGEGECGRLRDLGRPHGENRILSNPIAVQGEPEERPEVLELLLARHGAIVPAVPKIAQCLKIELAQISEALFRAEDFELTEQAAILLQALPTQLARLGVMEDPPVLGRHGVMKRKTPVNVSASVRARLLKEGCMWNSELPERASLEYLNKLAKDRLRELRQADPRAKLATALLAVAQDHGFSSWRALKAELDQRQKKHLALFFDACAKGDVQVLRDFLVNEPSLGHVSNPEAHYQGWTDCTRQPRAGHVDAVRLLLEHGADPSARDA